MRERKNAKITTVKHGKTLTLTLVHSLDQKHYNLPLTLKTYLPEKWSKVTISQGDLVIKGIRSKDDRGKYIIYQAKPNTSFVKIIGS